MAINIKLLRSSTASKRPTAANLEVGELGLNFSDATGGLFYENASGGIIKVGPAEVGTAAPNSTPGGSTGNSLGELWYDTGNTELKVYTGSGFVSAGGGVAGITSAADAEAIDIDSSENVTFRQNVEFEGDLTISGQHDISMDDNTANVIDFKQASNSYLAFNTTDGSENITISKNLVLGGDDLTATAALDVKVIDNSGLALRVMEGTNEYLRVVTTDGSESVTIKKTLETDGDLQIDGGVTMPVATDIGIVDNSGLALRVMEGTNEYIRFTTTDGGEKIQTAKELEVNGALNIDGAVDCSGDITFSDAQTISVVDNLGFALRIMEGTDEYMRVITTTGNESIEFDKAVVISNTLVFNSGAFFNGSIDFSLQAANSNALDFTINGGNNMMRFNTSTETVLVPVAFEVDGGARFDGAMDVNSTVDISGGEVTFSANADIQLVDNSGQALDIAEGANNYMRFITLDGSEEIEVYQAVELKAENISMTNTAGVDLTIIDNFVSALTIKSADGANYQSFKTSNSEPQVQFLQDVLILNGKKFICNNVEIDAIQTGSETFADNDTSLMTSAAVKDLVDTVSGVTQTEGTFTATFRGSTAEPGTLVTTTGYYVQVGKMVTATIDTGAVSWTGYGGVATVTGMPATAKSGFDFVGSFHSTGGLFESGNNDGMVCHMDGNSTTLDLRAQDSAVAPTWSPGGIDTIMFTITYFTA